MNASQPRPPDIEGLEQLHFIVKDLIMSDSNKQQMGWSKKILRELTEYWTVVLYLAIFFGIFTMYRRLILAHYEISYEEYGISAVKALVLAKVFLVAECLKLGRKFDDKPLVIPTLYKGLLFTFIVAVYTVIEALVRSLIRGTGQKRTVDELIGVFNYEWFAAALVVFFAFIPFFAMRELSRVLGKGALHALFFQKRFEAGDQSGRNRMNR